MPSLESRLDALETQAPPDAYRVIIYEPGTEPEIPAGAEVVILLPDNGRDDQEANRV